MSVKDWARREAERRYPTSRFSSTESHRETQIHQADMREGIVHVFSALLSDEAMLAAWVKMPTGSMPSDARAALQAAIEAVTEGARNE